MRYLKIEDELVKLSSDLVKCLEELVSIQVFRGESDESRRAMIGEKDEDLVIGSKLEYLFALSCGLIPFKNSQEVFRSHISSPIVDLHSRVDIDTRISIGGLVEDLALIGVIDCVGNIIIGESNDVFRIKAIFGESLVSMEDVSLVAVVAVGV